MSDDAIERVNATPYGLATGIFTDRIDSALQAAELTLPEARAAEERHDRREEREEDRDDRIAVRRRRATREHDLACTFEARSRDVEHDRLRPAGRAQLVRIADAELTDRDVTCARDVRDVMRAEGIPDSVPIVMAPLSTWWPPSQTTAARLSPEKSRLAG